MTDDGDEGSLSGEDMGRGSGIILVLFTLLYFHIFPFYECSIAQNSRFTHDDAFPAVVSTQDNIFGEGGWLHDCQSFCTSIG